MARVRVYRPDYIYGATIADSKEEAEEKFRMFLGNQMDMDGVNVWATEIPEGIMRTHYERHY